MLFKGCKFLARKKQPSKQRFFTPRIWRLQDEFYRNQFETGTSCGALDDGNVIRKVRPSHLGLNTPGRLGLAIIHPGSTQNYSTTRQRTSLQNVANTNGNPLTSGKFRWMKSDILRRCVTFSQHLSPAFVQGWETELFGGCYDESKPFERCKYGALSVSWTPGKVLADSEASSIWMCFFSSRDFSVCRTKGTQFWFSEGSHLMKCMLHIFLVLAGFYSSTISRRHRCISSEKTQKVCSDRCLVHKIAGVAQKICLCLNLFEPLNSKTDHSPIFVKECLSTCLWHKFLKAQLMSGISIKEPINPPNQHYVCKRRDPWSVRVRLSIFWSNRLTLILKTWLHRREAHFPLNPYCWWFRTPVITRLGMY